MENLEEKRELTLESSQPPDQNARPKPPAGKLNTPVMTEEEVADLLARLQDVLSLWRGSDNKIIGGFVMTALPIPQGMKIDKAGSHDSRVFTVNGSPVVSVDGS